MTDVLAIGAHPDDVELGAGGLIALLVSQGTEVAIADLTRGEMGTRGSPAERASEARAAAQALGVSDRENLDLGDAALTADSPRLLAVVRLIRRQRPRLLVAPLPADRHPDHEAAGRLAKRACYLAGLRNFDPDTPAFRPRHLIHYLQHEVVEPSFIVDVSAVYETKQRAIRCFASQLHDPTRAEPETLISRPAFLEEIEARDRHFGALIGARFGEAYHQPHPPRIVHPLELMTES